MQFVADENVPIASVRYLRQLGYQIDAISELSPGITDVQVLEYSENRKRILITFDLDFGELVFKKKAVATQGIIILRFIPCSAIETGLLLSTIFNSVNMIFEGFITIIERDYIRRRPLR
ncbi:MAG: DUF5615 family PIN-like protein [Chitinivibrionales bacterium]|nr:DUF5615 family PIN-like protein [Chitinivibrionales bacterium]